MLRSLLGRPCLLTVLLKLPLLLLLPQCCALPRSCSSVSTRGVAHRRSAAMSNGSLFAPKYVENKLKFYPNILEAVLFGNGRDHCCAFINIDLNAVGNWAERKNIS